MEKLQFDFFYFLAMYFVLFINIVIWNRFEQLCWFSMRLNEFMALLVQPPLFWNPGFAPDYKALFLHHVTLLNPIATVPPLQIKDNSEVLFRCTQNSKTLQDSSSHRIFERMNEVLNIAKQSN